jgi:hypothetical protein
MKYAKIVDGVVVDLILSDGPMGGYTTQAPDEVGIGFTYSGAGFAPPAPPTPPAPTVADYIDAVQLHMDTAARSLGYDSIFSAVTYADEPSVPQFQTEGSALRAWRSIMWAQCYTIMAGVEAQTRTAPTISELIAELPAFSLGA